MVNAGALQEGPWIILDPRPDFLTRPPQGQWLRLRLRMAVASL